MKTNPSSRTKGKTSSPYKVTNPRSNCIITKKSMCSDLKTKTTQTIPKPKPKCCSNTTGLLPGSDRIQSNSVLKCSLTGHSNQQSILTAQGPFVANRTPHW